MIVFQRVFGLIGVFMLHGCVASSPEYDILILGGTIVDGSGAPSFESDVAIRDDRIVAIGNLSNSNAHRVIDAEGRIVSPGFIDLHNHADDNIDANPGVENFLFQGVTTILAGNCGGSPVRLGEFWDALAETGTGPNIGTLIGHNSVRRAVMSNENRAPTPREQERMEQLVQSAMDAGAFGLSTGLIYVPGTYAETAEVVGLASVAARDGGIYASHLRNEFDQIVPAIEEAIHIGYEAHLPVHISHFKIADNSMWGESDMVLGIVERARAEGLDVTIDQYPYTASSTGFINVLPAWARAGTPEEFRARLDDPATRARVKTDTMAILNGARAAGDLSRITIASYGEFPQYVGKTLEEVTTLRGYSPTIANGAEVAMELLYVGRGSAIYHMMAEPDVERILQAPFTSIASDGSAVAYGDAVPHLRNYGAFPRVLRKYVVEQQVLTIEEAIHKMTGMPAERLGLSDRGIIAEGAIADLNIFTLADVRDNEDWANPHQYSSGFNYVIVNGTVAIEGGERNSKMPGRVLKRPRSVASIPID